MYRIGIIGFGFIGNELIQSISNNEIVTGIFIYDKYKETKNTIVEVCENSDLIFICVPTPSVNDYDQDIEPITDVLDSCYDYIKNTSKIIIIRSTILPGTTRILSETYPNINLIFSPEFLTQRSGVQDEIAVQSCKSPQRMIIGGENSNSIEHVYNLYNSIYNTKIYICSWEEAEFTKYMCNSYLALKVVFFSIFFKAINDNNCNWELVREMVLADKRIGDSHTVIPGNPEDNSLGYTGACFPKDVDSLIGWMRNNNVLGVTLFEAFSKINKQLRNKE